MVELGWPAAPEPASDVAALLARAPARPRGDLLSRQAYLRSYQFTVRESFSDRLRRGLKEAGEVGKAAVAEMVDRVFGEVGLGVKVLRSLGLRLQAAAMSPRRCFSGRGRRKKSSCYLEECY